MLKTELLASIARFGGDPLLAVDLVAMAAGPRSRGQNVETPKGVAIIPMYGALMSRGGSDWFGSWAGMDGLRAAIGAAAASNDVSAIVLAIDSPGGTVAGTPETAAAVRAAAAQKPVIAIADTLAASAAYWIGSQATKFVAAPSADLGSIGVVCMHSDYSRMLSEAGIDTTFITSTDAPFKVEGNPYQPLSDEAKANWTQRADESMADFVRSVAEGRGKTQSAVRETFGKGRTMGAQAALAAGMIDAITTMDALLADLTSSKKAARPLAKRAALI